MNHQLYVARRENKLHQKDVAEKLNIHPQTYYLKESGKQDFTISEAKRLSIIFNRTLDELFGGEQIAK
ncbi:MAG TPA: helix-turn-helix transcriptional regulator [Massilibacterium sp.]|nr:helix-turn-helix transcriptional regulator [Massilibacterium sp.]